MQFPDDDMTAMLEAMGLTAQVMIATYLAGEISVIWEPRPKVQNLFDNGFETSAPAAIVKSSDVAALNIAHNVKLIIAGATWYVIGDLPEGDGFTRLTLSSSPIQ